MSLPSIFATISGGASLSNAINIGGSVLAGIIMPDTWTAASLTFQVSNDGETYYDLFDDSGNEISCVVTAGKFVPLSAGLYYSVAYLKLRSGTSASPVNQAAAREFEILVRGE